METRELNNSDLQKETLEDLTARLSELNNQPSHNREETSKIMAEMDKRMDWEREKQLALFIDAEISKGGPLNTTVIKQKAKSLGFVGDMTPHINRVVDIRRRLLRQADE